MMEVVEPRDEDILDGENSLEAKKEEMKRLDSIFEEKIERLTHIMKMHKKEGVILIE
jgi:hypothetical protein